MPSLMASEPMGVTYDTGALLAAEANRRDLWVLHAQALRRGRLPVVPAPVLAQAWRGGSQASLSRLLRGCAVEPLDETRAKTAGTLCARSGTRDVVDAAVVASALARNDLVVTSDPDDLRGLAASIRRGLQVHPI
jgi:hypothetical protein